MSPSRLGLDRGTRGLEWGEEGREGSPLGKNEGWGSLTPGWDRPCLGQSNCLAPFTSIDLVAEKIPK